MILADVLAEAERMRAERLARRQWGRWRLDVGRLELVFEEGPGRARYFIDMERMSTSAAVLDWIFQVSKKTWCRRQDVGDLVAAIRDILDPQANLCSWACSTGSGVGDRIDATALLRSRYGERGGVA